MFLRKTGNNSNEFDDRMILHQTSHKSSLNIINKYDESHSERKYIQNMSLFYKIS